MPSIKNQILNGYVALLKPLVAADVFRSVTREMDVIKTMEVRDALMIYHGDETEIDKDNRGITFQFPLMFKVLVETNSDLSEVAEEKAAKVQAIVEAMENVQLGGLINGLAGGTLHPFINEIGGSVGGALILYTVEYRRLRGNPSATY